MKSLSDGTASIDRYHWETRDKAWTDERFYSVKAPGLSFAVLPLYEGLAALGAPEASRDVARAARRSGESRWAYSGLITHAYGYDASRARRVRSEVEGEAPIVWALGLLGSVLPAFLLLLALRSVVERVSPGTGAAAAVMLGGGTLVMVFASQLMGHMLSALLAFAAFALLWRERDGPQRLTWVLAAGLLAGLAVTTEYPLAIAGAIVGCYAISRPGLPCAGRRLLGRRRGRGGSAAALQPVGLRRCGPSLLRRRGRAPGLHGPLDAGPQRGRLLRHRHPAAGRRTRAPVLLTRPAGDQPRPGGGDRRHLAALPPRPPRRGADHRRGGCCLPRLRRRLLAALRRRIARPALPHPRPPVPVRRAGAGDPAHAGGHARPRGALGPDHAARHGDLSPDRRRRRGEWVHRALEATFVNTPLVPLGLTGWLAVAPLLVLVAAALACAARATEGIDVRADLAWGVRAVLAWGVIAAVGPAPWGDAALLGNWAELALVLTGVAAGLGALACASLRAGMPARALAPGRAGRSPRVAWLGSGPRSEVVEGDPATDLAL
ncbi:MAG: hypothetical protein WKF40_06090 [Thermoleophilaceae bacterium]